MCWFIFIVASLLVGGSVIVRSAVGMANRFLGAPSHPAQQVEELDEWIGYRQTLKSIRAIPDPGVGKGMLCVSLIVIIDFLASFVMRSLMGIGPFEHHRSNFDDPDMIFAHAFACLLCYPLCASLLANVLPTRFNRACFVLLWIYAIPLAIVLCVLAFIFVVI